MFESTSLGPQSLRPSADLPSRAKKDFPLASQAPPQASSPEQSLKLLLQLRQRWGDLLEGDAGEILQREAATYLALLAPHEVYEARELRLLQQLAQGKARPSLDSEGLPRQADPQQAFKDLEAKIKSLSARFSSSEGQLSRAELKVFGANQPLNSGNYEGVQSETSQMREAPEAETLSQRPESKTSSQGSPLRGGMTEVVQSRLTLIPGPAESPARPPLKQESRKAPLPEGKPSQELAPEPPPPRRPRLSQLSRVEVNISPSSPQRQKFPQWLQVKLKEEIGQSYLTAQPGHKRLSKGLETRPSQSPSDNRSLANPAGGNKDLADGIRGLSAVQKVVLQVQKAVAGPMAASKAAQLFQAVTSQGLIANPRPSQPKLSESSSLKALPEKEGGKERTESRPAPGGRPAGDSTIARGRGLAGPAAGSLGKLDNLASGWGQGSSESSGSLANGRQLTAHIPIYSPILDENWERERRGGGGSGQKKPPPEAPGLVQPPWSYDGRLLGELACRHAGHSMESLLKKAYRLDALGELCREDAVNALGLVLKMGGEFTFAHSARVLELALDLADELGVDDEKMRSQIRFGALLKDTGEMALLLGQAPSETLEEMGEWLSSQDLRQAGLLHDIGKTKIPPEILYKPGKLTQQEYELMKLHPILGEQIVYPITSLRHLCPVIRGHHERWDGQGYPDGLKGEAIPFAARIIAVADVFDALAAERPYKAGLAIEKVQAILQEGRGSHFDPQLVEAFAKVIQRRYPELKNPFA